MAFMRYCISLALAFYFAAVASSAGSTLTTLASSIKPTASGRCPPYNTSTYTAYNIFYSFNYTSTTTQTTTISPLVTTTITTIGHVTTYVSSTTATSTSTSTVTKVYVSPAKKTTTVPTVSGFTPILCEASYQNPTVTANKTYTFTQAYLSSVTVSDPSHTGTITSYRLTSTSTQTVTEGGTYLVEKFKTVTTTITRANPTQTVYAACQSDNITPYEPGAQYISNVDPIFTNPETFARVNAVDQVDCCNLCQANNTCSGSAFQPSYSPNCILIIQQYSGNATCDPTLVGEFTFSVSSLLEFYVSNSACGQYSINP